MSDSAPLSNLVRNEDGTWNVSVPEEILQSWNSTYRDALPRFLNSFGPAFEQAKQCCEFEFVFSLLRVRGLQDAGWDPYTTTLSAVPTLIQLASHAESYEAFRHIQLWIYGHVVEAAEPYEMLANLIGVAGGGRFMSQRFHPNRSGRPQSPGEKIRKIEEEGTKLGFATIAKPLKERWDRNLRNAIFHSDYSIHGSAVRIMDPIREYSDDEISVLLNKALASHDALAGLYKWYTFQYSEPKIIDVHPDFRRHPNEKSIIIVRQGYGAIGLKDAWTPDQLQRGFIPWRIGRFYRHEAQLLERNSDLAFIKIENQTVNSKDS